MVLSLVSAILVMAVWLSPSAVGLRSLADEPSTLPPVQIVLLVDESGSLSADGVAREKEAARTIALGAVSRDTTVSVVGFGSSDGSPGQTAAITRCPPTKVDSAQSRDMLARCIDGVHARKPSEGSRTDHVAALRQALGFLSAGTQATKIVFLLTDGDLDVQDSPAYGRSPEARNQAARDQIPEVLEELHKVDAQVWPLGFGRLVSLDKLKAFEAGIPCTPKTAKPTARVIENPTALTSAIIAAYKSAGCVGGGGIDTQTLPKAGMVDFTVDIPAIASDSSILVYKRHPGVQVQYIDPNNKTAPGTESSDSTFQLAGQGTETESLHIVDPVPGRWTLRLTSTSDIPPHEVAATVLFQGAVNAVLAVTPAQPVAGQEVEVAMQVRTRRTAITDASQLSGLDFRLSLTGSNGVIEQVTSLVDDDRDGTFTARLRVPENATGSLTFTGTVNGIGVSGETRVFATTVLQEPADLQGQLQLTGPDSTVVAGESVAGEVLIGNNSGRERTLRLQLADLGPGTLARVSPSTITVPASGTVKVPFSIEFGTGTLLGSNQARLRVVDDSDPSVVVAELLIAREVVPPPVSSIQVQWLLIVLTLLVVPALLIRLRAVQKSRTVAGLRVELRCGGMALHALKPLIANATVFRFVIHDDGFTASQLQHADHSDVSAYEVRRAGGELTLTPPYGPSLVIRPGEAHSVRSDLAVVVYDDSARSTNELEVTAGVGATSRAADPWDVDSDSFSPGSLQTIPTLQKSQKKGGNHNSKPVRSPVVLKQVSSQDSPIQTILTITIYLSEESVHEQVETAVEDLLAAAGGHIEHRDDPVLGSWFRRMRAKIGQAVHSEHARQVTTLAAHATEARLVHAQDATVTATMLQNLGPVLTAIQPTREAVIRAGALLIVKIDSILVVHQLTPAQQRQLDHQPQLAQSPHDILSALKLQPGSSTQSENGVDNICRPKTTSRSLNGHPERLGIMSNNGEDSTPLNAADHQASPESSTGA